MSDLKSVKREIKVISPDEKKNKEVMELIQNENDCFGIGFLEDSEQCATCTILAELADKREPLREFCKEFTEAQDDKKSKNKAPSGKKSLPELVEDLLKEGKSDQEIEAVLIKAYEEKGRDADFAKSRASGFISAAKKKLDLKGEEKMDSEEKVGKKSKEGKANSVDFAKNLVSEGKSDEDIIKILRQVYLDKGKDEKFADKRARHYLKLARK